MNNLTSNIRVDEFANLNINYGKDSITDKYIELSKNIDLDNHIKYKEVKFQEDAFPNDIIHIVISVKVSDESPFIPFLDVLGPQDKQSALKDMARGLQNQGKGRISYNYSDFLKDIESAKNRGLMRLSFETSFNGANEEKFEISNGQIIGAKISSTQLWLDKQGNDEKDGINDLMQELLNKEKCFAKEIAIEYLRKFQIQHLYFSIFSFDASYDGGGFLTRLMLIGTKEEELDYYIKRRLDKVREFVSSLRTRYTYDLIQKNRWEATKSAKVAIMSRNMSHNLGSHVMAYLKEKLGSVSAILNKENKVLNNLYLYDDNELKKAPKENVEMPFLVGLGRFIGYLQERQDYIATIATDYIPYGAPVNMKDAIYDELNPDLRHLRHNASGSEKDQNLPFNVLLSYIAKSENLSRENMGYNNSKGNSTQGSQNQNLPQENKEDNKSNGNSILAQFTSERDILFGYITYSKKGERIVEHTFGLDPNYCGSSDASLAQMRKINFSLPGGLVGRQAIFSIVENLIRNAAKHGDTRSVNNLCFTFDVIDCAKIGMSYEAGGILDIEKRICDSRWRTLYANANDRSDLYLLTITDNLSYDKSVLESLLPGLTEDYIDEVGVMTTANKGIKEIRISAAWLRGDTNEKNYYRYDNKTDTPKLAPLVAIEVTSDNHLRYIVALKKNRFVAYVKEGMTQPDLAIFNELNAKFPNDWVGFESISDALKESKNSYKYILVADEERYNKIRPFSSNRVRVWAPSDQQRMYINTPRRDPHGEEIPIETKVLSVIYQIFTKIDSNSEFIHVWDGKANESHKEEDIYPSILLLGNEDKKENAKYVYRTHHSAEYQFKDYWEHRKSLYKGIIAIDAITGDNSSDRLVRREPLNEEWYYSHLNALKKKVAIFDERLFRIAHNITDEKIFFTKGNKKAKDLLEKLINKEISLDEAKNDLLDSDFLPIKSMVKVEECYSIDELIPILKPYATAIEFHDQEITGNHKSIVYAEKGVDIFTIIKDESADNSYIIIGCSDCSSNDTNLYSAHFKKIGVISASHQEEFEVHVQILDKDFKNKFDYISIHQGLLDKIYEGFGIKKQNDINDEYKKQVTAALYRCLMKDNKTIGKYLPCFIIHSGRAKPTKDDMPQKQPFIQYAAIENGVKDCKFSLIELLDYARYEKSSNEEEADI